MLLKNNKEAILKKENGMHRNKKGQGFNLGLFNKNFSFKHYANGFMPRLCIFSSVIVIKPY